MPSLHIETAAPRIAQPERPDFLFPRRIPLVGIALGNGVRISAVHVDPQDLPQQGRSALPVANRSMLIKSPTTISRSYVKISIIPKAQPSAIMIRFRLGKTQNQLTRQRCRRFRGCRITRGGETQNLGAPAA